MDFQALEQQVSELQRTNDELRSRHQQRLQRYEQEKNEYKERLAEDQRQHKRQRHRLDDAEQAAVASQASFDAQLKKQVRKLKRVELPVQGRVVSTNEFLVAILVSFLLGCLPWVIKLG